MALSGWYLTGAEGILQQSDTEAYLWARKAADKGLSKAEYAVGYYTENGVGVVQPSLDEARRWYLRAAGQGNKRAVQRLRDIKDILHAANRQHKQQQKQQHQDLRRGGQHNNADCVVM